MPALLLVAPDGAPPSVPTARALFLLVTLKGFQAPPCPSLGVPAPTQTRAFPGTSLLDQRGIWPGGGTVCRGAVLCPPTRSPQPLAYPNSRCLSSQPQMPFITAAHVKTPCMATSP